ncbi:hypothetical protein PTSG_03864 [Salpingoeca rosetta]|uniref:Uncharacterized protein n=1 Tax=Salpingoeca rosetta (strain ATCC 50818 / BSB-021) TaxID=946362 RepID=F2U5L6_SALR5|nr:uncharacterized protein PTSG_03864 [Salpingoeca rosetta]EGD83232.1 hypothetical protein PTSG_03864 [Salpingoeca rosetta]|eukprot:XP_004995596.1 hypothetical protein PTSG_03864 [Salpingoeca rosetta]
MASKHKSDNKEASKARTKKRAEPHMHSSRLLVVLLLPLLLVTVVAGGQGSVHESDCGDNSVAATDTMSSEKAADARRAEVGAEAEAEAEAEPRLALPSAMANPDKESTLSSLTVDGDAVALDELGPMVVNKDGTLSRITNWRSMSEQEQATTLRVLKKRNAQRIKALGGQLPGNVKVQQDKSQQHQQHQQQKADL